MNTRIRRYRHLFVCLALIAGTTMAATATGPNYYIPFADQGGIRDWQADGSKGLWVRSLNGSWYYATFMTPCTQLPFAFNGLRFIVEATGELDRWSSIAVPHSGRCYFSDFQASNGPPRKKKKKE